MTPTADHPASVTVLGLVAEYRPAATNPVRATVRGAVDAATTESARFRGAIDVSPPEAEIDGRTSVRGLTRRIFPAPANPLRTIMRGGGGENLLAVRFAADPLELIPLIPELTAGLDGGDGAAGGVVGATVAIWPAPLN